MRPVLARTDQLFVATGTGGNAGAKVKHRFGAVGLALSVLAVKHIDAVRKLEHFFGIISEIFQYQIFYSHSFSVLI